MTSAEHQRKVAELQEQLAEWDREAARVAEQRDAVRLQLRALMLSEVSRG